ncbi:hypothetical protein LOAG_09799 [Loa loa]|uniref:EF-hand domain-containing protein n=2 Tax=Loa loa TaxID=7209 RepID=A0A1S0TR61_LOALO|nr:hypothetical protein LOAG_09799 [Loa loa]EFO18697.2 hypothetical protein LOAG_09799 [Loa loa]
MFILPAMLHHHHHYHHHHRDILLTTTLQFIILVTQILPSTQVVGMIPQSSDSSSIPPPLPPPVPVKFGEKDAVHDTAHIKQHLKHKLDVAKISLNKNLETFHYFRMHDLNKDGKIDGIEIIKGLTHLHEEMNKDTGPISEAKLEEMVSETLRKLDTDDDGYITYAEYRQIV